MFKKKEPVRLKKQEDGIMIKKILQKIKNILYILRVLYRMPEFWLCFAIAIGFILLIGIAVNESVSYFVYNNGLSGV